MGRMAQAALAAAALALAGAAAATPKEDVAAWWRGYEGAPFAKAPDGRRIRYYCLGKGSPTVVTEAGLGSGAWSWRTIQTEMAKTTRVCSYDRAGYGLSDEAKDSRDLDAIAADLGVVVQAAGAGRPVVLVAHSLGGPIVRQYAYHHPEKVAGLVLVDPSADHQTERFSALTPDFMKLSAAGNDPIRKCQALTEKGPIAFGTPDYVRCVGPAPLDMPPELSRFHVAYGQSPVHYRTILAEYANALSPASGAEADKARHPLGATPMIILTAGKPTTAPGLSEADSVRITALWRQMHWEMTGLSTDARRRFVDGAGHAIQIDRPQAVIDAVGEVVAEARAGRTR
jgi:pimeloyl-ACP methyl ester carboxylesterase